MIHEYRRIKKKCFALVSRTSEENFSFSNRIEGEKKDDSLSPICNKQRVGMSNHFRSGLFKTVIRLCFSTSRLMAQLIGCSLLIILDLLLSVHSFTCLTNCSFIYLPSTGASVKSALEQTMCLNETDVRFCKGQIIVFYSEGSLMPKSINYTLGFVDSQFQQEMAEHHIEAFSWQKLNQYRLTINITKKESILISNIFCSNEDQCAWSEIKTSIEKYRRQPNPYDHFKSMVYSESAKSKTLRCYQIQTDTNELCSTSNKVCLASSKIFEHGCSSNQSDIYIHEEFLSSSPPIPELDKRLDLVYCNKDDCNSHENLYKIQLLAHDYVSGNGQMKNNMSQKTLTNLFPMTICFLFIHWLNEAFC